VKQGFLCSVILALGSVVFCAHGSAAPYSLVINNGRVIDPETGLDAIRHLGIHAGKIVEIAAVPLEGQSQIDATGLVVAPGFIDLHTHSPTLLGQYFQAFDGVTTALELEAGFHPVSAYAASISATPLINYGASAGHVMARVLEKNGLLLAADGESPRPVGLKGWMTALTFFFTDADTALSASMRETASPSELNTLREHLEQNLDQGALGIGLPLDYFSDAIGPAEMHMLFEVAGRLGAPIFIHIRRGLDGDPAGLEEVITLAAKFRAPIHICHITHSAISALDEFLALIRQARKAGVDISTEVLPYNAGSAAIGSAVFGRNWQEIFNISYQDVQWAATGERLTASRFDEYRQTQPDGPVIHHYLKEEWTQRAVAEPGVIIVSDLLAMQTRDKKVAPHNGAFSKILARYVRQESLLDLNTALRKMTLLPAMRLQAYAPAFARKGRIQEGMDADITIFDPHTVLDRATYEDPYQEAEGIEHVIVNGQPIIRKGKLVPNTYPGKRMLADDSRSSD
jgi:cytosine/adenosine deaminase-related metal-dependent hydrolase